jgi:hypothetical protein
VLSSVVAQRLARKIDPESELAWEKPTDVEREWLMKRQMFSAGMLVPRIVKGGFKGRIPLVEMIEITAPIRRLIEDGGDDATAWVPKIVELARKQEQFETLAQAGVRTVLEGKTTLQEVMDTTSEVAYIPTQRRWEQILIHQGHLKVSDLERMREEIYEQRKLGTIISLKHHLINTKTCSMRQVVLAMGEAEYVAEE